MKMVELLDCVRNTKAGNHCVEVLPSGVKELYYHATKIVTVKPHLKLFAVDNSYGSVSTTKAVNTYRRTLTSNEYTEVTWGIYNNMLEGKDLLSFCENLEQAIVKLDKSDDPSKIVLIPNTSAVICDISTTKEQAIENFMNKVVKDNKAFRKAFPSYNKHKDRLEDAELTFSFVAQDLGEKMMNHICFATGSSYLKYDYYITLHLTMANDVFWVVGKRVND